VNRILVVDDEPDLRITYERLLRRSGYRVVTAGSQHEGLSLVMAEPPRLVISDPPVPVIVVTAFASQALRESARALGASALLTKPFAASELLRLVHAELSPPER
jgi:CheY-like chemotaxis protein